MKSRNVFFAFLILAIVGLAAYGYFKSIPAVKNETGNLPEIKISPKTFDFGKVRYGDLLEHSFRLKNTGEEILEIKEVATSCACTAASSVKEQISPGEETELKVVYDTGAMSGPRGRGEQERTIYIKSNDPLNPRVEAMIYAYVR